MWFLENVVHYQTCFWITISKLNLKVITIVTVVRYAREFWLVFFLFV